MEGESVTARSAQSHVRGATVQSHHVQRFSSTEPSPSEPSSDAMGTLVGVRAAGGRQQTATMATAPMMATPITGSAQSGMLLSATLSGKGSPAGRLRTSCLRCSLAPPAQSS